MSPSSDKRGGDGSHVNERDRGQLEPVPALVAALVVASALGVYVGALDGALARYRPDRDLAGRTLDAVGDHIRRGGATRPQRLSTVDRAVPTGRRLNVTLATGDRRWHAGPPVRDPTAPGLERAQRRVAVRIAPGRVRTGWLEVTVW